MASYVPLPETIKTFFEKNGKKLTYERKQQFVRADDLQPWVYFLSEGIVEAAYTFDNGDSRILGYFVENSIFSQNRLFYDSSDGDLRYTTVEKSTVYRVHQNEFLQQLEGSLAFNKEYLQNTLIFRIFTTDLVIYLGESSIHKRCVRWLLMMAKYYGEPSEHGVRITIPFTHDTVANFLHVSRESVSKTLRNFVRSEHIRVDKKYITILDIPRLKSELQN